MSTLGAAGDKKNETYKYKIEVWLGFNICEKDLCLLVDHKWNMSYVALAKRTDAIWGYIQE